MGIVGIMGISMACFMDLTTRIDVLDLLIEVLAGHEKELDGLIDRLERAVSVAER